MLPKISIITPTYNQAKYIERTIKSVLEQEYPHLEYIVLDAQSTDSTRDILKRYDDKLTWISEPDGGQSEAINKGFKMATGEIVAWLNSDDVYAQDTLHTIGHFFANNPDTYFAYGHAILIDENDRQFGFRANVRQGDLAYLLIQGDPIIQPAAFWRKSVMEDVGYLDTDLHYVMDYEFWMRIAKHHKLHFLSQVFAYERFHRAAKTHTGDLERIRELEKIAEWHGGNGIPRLFRPEASSTLITEAIASIRKRDFSTSRQYIGKALALTPNLWIFLLYIVSKLFFPSKVVYFRMYSNWIRSRFLRMPKVTNQLVSY